MTAYLIPVTADGGFSQTPVTGQPAIEFATEEYVGTAITNLIDTAPTALNTLNELAAALGDDANYAATITTALGNKADSSSLSTVATSGSYADLSDKPTIPTNTNQLTNGAGFITSNGIPSQSSNNGKYLTTDGSSLSWETVAGGGGTTTNLLKAGPGISTNEDLIATLSPPTQLASDYYGNSVAVSSSIVVVGAKQKSASSNYSGTVYIHDQLGNIRYTLTDPNGYGTANNDYFGYSVAVSDNGQYVIVGTPNEDDAGGTDSGKVYIYDTTTFTAYSGSIITVASATRTIANPNAAGNTGSDYFGNAVAISGDYLVVGAKYEEDASSNSQPGKVYIFNVTTGALLYTIDDPNAYSTPGQDYFGWSVDISGNRVIIGAPGEDDASGTGSGKAYVFNISTFPASPATITSSNYTSYGYVVNNPNVGAPQFMSGNVEDFFGTAVSINGSHFAVGAPSDKGSAQSGTRTGGGSVYLYELTTSNLVGFFQAYDDFAAGQASAPDNTSGNKFGWALAMSDTKLIVGTSGSYVPGAAYIYNLSTLKLEKLLYNPNSKRSTLYDAFGSSVGIYGDYAVVGAQYEDTYTNNADSVGQAYLYTTKNTFDGSAVTTFGLTQTGVAGGTYGSIWQAGSQITVPTLSVDSFGRIIQASEATYYVSSGLTSAFTSVAVDGTIASYSSGQTTINFEAGDNVTLAYSTNISNYPTITINSTASSSGGGGTGGAFKYTSVSLSNSMTADFSLPADATISTSIFTVVNFSGTGINMPMGWQFASVNPSSMGDPNDMLFRGIEVSGTQTATFNSPSYGSIEFFEWNMDPMDVYYSVFASLGMFQPYQQSNMAIQNVNSSFSLNWNSTGYCYGYIIAGGGGWSDLATFVPASNVDAYVDATNQVVFFKCPASIWANGSGLIGGTTSQAMNASMYLYLYYFGQ